MDRVLREISRTLLKPGPEIGDGQLLEMFRVRRNEAAFEAIVHRHGPMVLAVCRRILGNHHDAEDAFQATFLVLARKSTAIAPRDMAASWLYGVAVRTAQKARTQAARIRMREWQAAVPIDAQTATCESDFDLRESLDRELARLPEKYRTPIVLCDLEGKSHKEAARELRWPEGTLSVRLMRAKKLLAQRLAQRGIAPAAGALAILMDSAAQARVPSALANSAVALACPIAENAATVPAKVAILAEEVLRGLVMNKLKSLAGTIVLLGLFVVGAVYLARALSAGSQAAPPAEDAVAQLPEQRKNDKSDGLDVAPNGQPTLDAFGDLLPEGAAARLGPHRFRSDGPATQLAFAPSGKVLVGATLSGVVIWESANGIERHRLPITTYGLGISPDGAMLALGEATPEGSVLLGLWDMRSGKRIRSLSIPKEDIPMSQPYRFSFASDGRSLAVSRIGWGKAMVFDVASGQVLASFGGRDSFAAHDVALSSDGKTLVAATHAATRTWSDTKSRRLRWWDVATGTPIRAAQEISSMATSMVFTPDGSSIALVFKDTIQILDSADGSPKCEFEAQKGIEISRIVFSPDSTKLAALQGDAFRIWDLTTGRSVRAFKGNSRTVNAMAFDGNTLAQSATGRTVHLWDVATGKELFDQSQDHDSTINDLAISPDGKTLVSAGWRQRTLVWDWASKKKVAVLAESADAVSFSPDGKRLALASTYSVGNRGVRIRDSGTREESLRIDAPEEAEIRSVAYSPDGRKLFTLDRTRHDDPNGQILYDYAVRHWDAVTGKPVQSWTIPQACVSSLAPDGKSVVIATDPARIYDVETGRSKPLSAGRPGFWPRNLSPDGRLVAFWSGEQGSLQICEVVTGQEIFVGAGHQGYISVVAWSPDGRLVATGDRSTYPVNMGEPSPKVFFNLQSVRVWDTATGMRRASFGGFHSDVTALTFTRDGAAVVAGLQDSTILTWDLGQANPRVKLAMKLSPAALETRWTDLKSDKASEAHQAIGVLISAPEQAVPFLRDRLRPRAAVDEARIRRWIADLDNDQFAVRESATRELANVGTEVEPHVRRALRGDVSAETRQRLDGILDAVENDRNRIRTIRAITVLERIGSPESRAALEALAGVARGWAVTDEAAAALERLARRK